MSIKKPSLSGEPLTLQQPSTNKQLGLPPKQLGLSPIFSISVPPDQPVHSTVTQISRDGKRLCLSPIYSISIPPDKAVHTTATQVSQDDPNADTTSNIPALPVHLPIRTTNRESTPPDFGPRYPKLHHPKNPDTTKMSPPSRLDMNPTKPSNHPSFTSVLTTEMRIALHIGFSTYDHLSPSLRTTVFNTLFAPQLLATPHGLATQEELIYQDAIRIWDDTAEKATWDAFDRGWWVENAEEEVSWEMRAMKLRWGRVLRGIERLGREESVEGESDPEPGSSEEEGEWETEVDGEDAGGHGNREAGGSVTVVDGPGGIKWHTNSQGQKWYTMVQK